jgi:hypothetical protein
MVCRHLINIGYLSMSETRLHLLEPVNKLTKIWRFHYRSVEHDCNLPISSLVITVFFNLRGNSVQSSQCMVCCHVINIGYLTTSETRLHLLEPVNKLTKIWRFHYRSVEYDCHLPISSLAITSFFNLWRNSVQSSQCTL